jgi:aryl-alcohol dehydrogenase-like predicted oxidoreductase
MRYIRIPGTELQPSTICLGTGNIGSAIDPSTSFALLDAYLNQGGNFLDTAKVYADWLPGEKSVSEKTIGQWLRQRSNRNNVILATKGAHPELTAMHIPRLSRSEIVYDLQESLKNLQTEVIDLYWLHRDDVHRPVEEIIETLTDQVQAGKIRYFGCSNWRMERIKAAQVYAYQRGGPGFIANQMMWSLAVVNPKALPDQTMVVMDDELKRYHLETGLAAIPYSSQANGWFQRRARDTVGQMKATLRGMYGGMANEHRFRCMTQLASESGLLVTDIVLGYLQSQPFPTIPIVGCQSIDQLRDSLSAGDVSLSPDQVKYLEQEENLESTS